MHNKIETRQLNQNKQTHGDLHETIIKLGEIGFEEWNFFRNLWMNWIYLWISTYLDDQILENQEEKGDFEPETLAFCFELEREL